MWLALALPVVGLRDDDSSESVETVLQRAASNAQPLFLLLHHVVLQPGVFAGAWLRL